MDKYHTLAFKILRGLATVSLLTIPLAVMFQAVSPLPGHAQGPEEVLLYEEHFSTGEPAGWSLNWWSDNGGWEVKDGRLVGSGHAWAYYTDGHWGGDGYSFRFRLIDLVGGMHVNIHVSDAVRYAIGFLRTGESSLSLYLFKQFGPDTFSPTLRTGEISILPGREYQVEIVTVGREIMVWVYKQEIAPEAVRLSGPAFTYPEPDPLPPGTIGFETLDGAVAQVDDIEVYGPPPTEPPPTEPPPTEPPPPFVDGVEPQQVSCGRQVELDVFGGHFLPEAWVEIGGEGVLLHKVEFINAEHLRAFVEVWDDAPLGWREVIVTNPDEQAGGQERALEVIRGGLPVLDLPALHEVEPHEVKQGSEVELTLFGDNFAEETAVLIHGRGVEVHECHFVDPSCLIVQIAVSADAEPGSRLVELNTAGGRTELANGLLVLERGTPPGPPPPSPPASPSSPKATPSGLGGDGEPGPIPDWVWAGATVLLSGLSFTVGRTLAIKSKLTWTEKARVQWRVEAQNKLPEPKRACQWACKANVSANLLDRWHVTAIELNPLKSKGKTIPKKRVEGKILAPLDDLANMAKILQREDEVRRRLAPIVDALLTQIMAWEQEGQTPAAIEVEAKLEAPINAQFGLYHCGQTKEGLDWGKPLVTWKGKLNQPGGEFLGVLRGPTAGEPDFAARARRDLQACLLDLVSVARFRL